MGHGIGPQSLGAPGQNPKSKPCGTPLDFNEKLRAALPEIKEKNPGFAEAIEADSGTNYGTPLPMIAPGTMGSIAQNVGSIFSKRRRGSMEGGSSAQGAAQMAAAGAQAQSIGGGSAGIQSDLEGLQSKLADLKSQIDNLANTV